MNLQRLAWSTRLGKNKCVVNVSVDEKLVSQASYYLLSREVAFPDEFGNDEEDMIRMA